MRRIVLVLALTALIVAVSVTGSALAQIPPNQSCEGLVTAVTKQEDAALPPADRAKSEGSQGAEHSVVREKAEENPNCKLEKLP